MKARGPGQLRITWSNESYALFPADWGCHKEWRNMNDSIPITEACRILMKPEFRSTASEGKLSIWANA